LPLP
jgi:hypothetical protein